MTSDLPRALLVATLVAAPAVALAAPEADEPLMDNSFLVEEAYNQEAGVVQQIGTFLRDRASGAWLATFTQEWPVPDATHQLSYTLSYGRDGGLRGLGDTLLNYRYQAAAEDGKLAFAPRLSLVLPGTRDGLGFRGLGVQANLPFSVTLRPWLVAHSNLGFTWVPSGRDAAGVRTDWRSLSVAQSFVWLVHPRFNVMAELLWTSTDAVAGGVTHNEVALTVSPGVRWGIDLPADTQVVLGLAAPLGVGPSRGDRAVFAYLSVELPFWHPGGGAAQEAATRLDGNADSAAPSAPTSWASGSTRIGR